MNIMLQRWIIKCYITFIIVRNNNKGNRSYLSTVGLHVFETRNSVSDTSAAALPLAARLTMKSVARRRARARERKGNLAHDERRGRTGRRKRKGGKEQAEEERRGGDGDSRRKLTPVCPCALACPCPARDSPLGKLYAESLAFE